MTRGNGENISTEENDFLYINDYINWSDELDEEEILKLESLLGKFCAFTIHWRDNFNFYSILQELNNNFLYVIDNDHWEIKTALEISKLSIEDFDKWILGKN